VLSLVLAKQPYKVPGAQAPQPRAPAPAPDKAIVLVRHARCGLMGCLFPCTTVPHCYSTRPPIVGSLAVAYDGTLLVSGVV
jgi:hypothetical protein